MTDTASKTSLWENGLLWFGAALSIAEIQTGTFMAPLGFEKGMTAIILGHLIGCGLLFGAGLIGARTGRRAMETVKMSFGSRGGHFFALLNILQLLGWTGIMIYEGALAAGSLFGTGEKLWCLLLGGLIMCWIALGLKRLGRLNVIAMGTLLLLTLFLSSALWGEQGGALLSGGELSFSLALELSIAMPLSWLPLISDYTSTAREPVRAAALSAVTYGAVSCWMYAIGLWSALTWGESDIAQIMLKAGLGMGGLLIILLSTVTTTFLDAHSAGVSGQALLAGLNEKYVALAVTCLGTAGALFLPLLNFTEFLYFIGSVFAPMLAVQLADCFVLGKGREAGAFAGHNFLLWLAGFVLYRLLMQADLPVGSTIPAMVFTVLLCAAREFLQRKSEPIRGEVH